MQPHSIVSREEWIAARKAHLAHEKEYTKATPLGRHEEGLSYPTDWVRLRDQYQPAPVQASWCHS
jgi:predicted dithiol-disulfide oxidoreductase (DUF899 family)